VAIGNGIVLASDLFYHTTKVTGVALVFNTHNDSVLVQTMEFAIMLALPSSKG